MIETLPERALIKAVLERAILDAVNGDEGAVNAYDWITRWCDEDRAQPMSFVWICLHLDLDPGRTRDAVVRLRTGDDEEQIEFPFVKKEKRLKASMCCPRRFLEATRGGPSSATELEVYY